MEISVKIAMLDPSQGGRHQPCLFTGYRPHFVVVPGELLGVEFIAVPDTVLPNIQVDARVRLPYDVDYSSLSPGASFTIVEGSRRVGHGHVVAP